MNQLLFSPSVILKRKQIKESISKLSNISSANLNKGFTNSQTNFLSSTRDSKVKLPTLLSGNSSIRLHRKHKTSTQHDSYSKDRTSSRANLRPRAERSLSSASLQGSNTTFISKSRHLRNTSSVSNQNSDSIQASKDELFQQQRNKNAQLKKNRDHAVKTWKTQLEIKHKKEAYIIRLSKYRHESEKMTKKINEFKEKHASCSKSRKERVLLTLSMRKEFQKSMSKSKMENDCSIEFSKDNSFLMNQQRNKKVMLNKEYVFLR